MPRIGGTCKVMHFNTALLKISGLAMVAKGNLLQADLWSLERKNLTTC